MLSMMGAPHPESLTQRLRGCHTNGIFPFVLMVMCLFNNVCLLQDHYLNHADSEYTYVNFRTIHSQCVMSISCRYSTSTTYCQQRCWDRIRLHTDTTSVNRHLKVNGMPMCMGGCCCDNGSVALYITLHSGTSSQPRTIEVEPATVHSMPATTWVNAPSYDVNKLAVWKSRLAEWSAQSNVTKTGSKSQTNGEIYHVCTVVNECISNPSEFIDIFQIYNNQYWTSAVGTLWEVKIEVPHPRPAPDPHVTSNTDVIMCFNCTLWLEYRVPQMGAILASDSDIGYSLGWCRCSGQYCIFASITYISTDAMYSTYLSQETKNTSDCHDIFNRLWAQYEIIFNSCECKYMVDAVCYRTYHCRTPQLYNESGHAHIYLLDRITDDYDYVDILQD